MATRSKTTPKKTTTKAKSATTAPKAATTKAKTATPKVAAKPGAATPTAPKATVVETVKPVVSGAPIKKPELVERVVAESGMKKKDVKPVVEALLKVLGQSLSEGEELQLPPLGKVMVKRSKDVANAQILNVKIRHPKVAGGGGKDPLAQAAE